jgi:multidrug efflux pump subunit AcrA (membrane-fusion protein)
MKRRRLSLAGIRHAAPLLSLMLLAGCGSQQPGSQVPERSATAVKVQIASVKEDTSQTQRLPGTVRAIRSAALASKLMGTILQVRVQAGDRVKAGQLLAVIDSREAEAMIHKAEAGRREAEMALQETESQIAASQANLTLSDATLKRYETLRVEKSVTPQEFEEVQTRQRAAAASLEALQARKQQVLAKAKQVESNHRNAEALHSYAELRAPFDGLLTQKHADPGSLAVPGVPVLTVEETGRYRLEVRVERAAFPPSSQGRNWKWKRPPGTSQYLGWFVKSRPRQTLPAGPIWSKSSCLFGRCCVQECTAKRCCQVDRLTPFGSKAAASCARDRLKESTWWRATMSLACAC